MITRNGIHTTQQLLVADKQWLIDRVAAEYRRINNFSATVDMVPALGSVEKSKVTEYKDVRGYILFRKPAEIRIVGLYPVVRAKAFDMVSNGSRFELYLPAKNSFIVGENEVSTPSKNKLQNLRPQHFIDGMLVRPVQPDEHPVLEDLTDEHNAAYVLLLIREAPDGQLQLSRSIWFDRLTLQLTRQLIFNPDGYILTDARYSQWRYYDGVPFPKQVEIDRPRDEYGVTLTVVKMDINQGVSADKFVLRQPEGTKLVVLGQRPPAVTAETGSSEAISRGENGKK